MEENKSKIIKDLEGNEVDIQGLFNLDANVSAMVNLLLSSIEEAKSKNIDGDTVVSNYNTYTFSFSKDLITISGLTEKDNVLKLKLSDFLSELQELKK